MVQKYQTGICLASHKRDTPFALLGLPFLRDRPCIHEGEAVFWQGWPFFGCIQPLGPGNLSRRPSWLKRIVQARDRFDYGTWGCAPA
jgi:hypothetical protein